MKFLKGLLITLIALFAVYVLLSFFLPSNTYVERNVEINAPAETVWSTIFVFKNWEAWSPWIENDPSINNVYTGTDGDLGSKMSWTSDSSGVGFMEILESVPNEKLVAIKLISGNGDPNTTELNSPWTPENLFLTASNKLNRKPIQQGLDAILAPLILKGIQ